MSEKTRSLRKKESKKQFKESISKKPGATKKTTQKRPLQEVINRLFKKRADKTKEGRKRRGRLETKTKKIPSEPEDKLRGIYDDNELPAFIRRTMRTARTGAKETWENFIESVTHPKRTIIELIKSKQFITNSLAIIVGIVGALAAWGFEYLVNGSKYLFIDQLFQTLAANLNSWRFIAIILTPVLASILISPIIWKIAPEIKGSGIPSVMESIVYRDGYIRKRVPFLKMVSSAICIGGGLSVGREGPITQIGAGFSSIIGRFVGLHGRNLRLVVISGLSAAIAATFNSPIGGALFGIEILLVSLIADEIVPVVLASLTASTISALIDILSPAGPGIPQPSFNVDTLRALDWNAYILDLHWFIIFGIVAGFIGIFYAKIIHFTQAICERLPVSKMVVPVLGALFAGSIAIASPTDEQGIPLIFGAGYATIENVLENSTKLDSLNPTNSLVLFLFLLIVLKTLITAFSVGSGNPGGIFAPALFIGACSGSFFANSVNNLLNIDLNVPVFALAGLASVFAGATRAPLTMIFMGAEMTGNITMMIPLMLTCSISYLVCRGILTESIYTQGLADRGLKVTLGGNITVLSTTTVEDIMTREVITIHKDAKMRDSLILVKDSGPFGFPVIDDERNLLGIITISDIRKASINNKLDAEVMEYATTNLILLNKEQTADEALDILNRAKVKRAPVVESYDEKKLVGILSKNDILRSFELEKLEYLKKARRKEKSLNKFTVVGKNEKTEEPTIDSSEIAEREESKDKG